MLASYMGCATRTAVLTQSVKSVDALDCRKYDTLVGALLEVSSLHTVRGCVVVGLG